jgi:DNA-binding beta-propeller fold protein YncE
MKKPLAILFALSLASVGLAQEGQPIPMQTMSGLLRLVETVPLPLHAYIDHLTVDVKGRRLFISGEESKRFVTVDLRTDKVIHVTEGLSGNPRKPFYLPDTNEIWVDLADNHVVAISGKTYEVTKTVDLPVHPGQKSEPDNAAYDPARHLYYAAVRTGESKEGSIEIVNTETAKHVGSIPLKGSEAGGLAIEPSGKTLYAGMGDVVNGESMCEVIDLEKRAVVAEWPITGGPSAHAAGLDAVHHRLFMGSRVRPGHTHGPGKLVVMDTETGKVVQALDAVAGVDEVQYDAATGRIYYVGSTGTIEVFKEVDPDHYKVLGEVPTGAIAKTGLWVPELKQFYSAVPEHLVETPPHVPNDNIIEQSHLMIFDYIP